MNFKEIDHLLDLCRIELEEKEKEKIASELAKILSYIDQLKKVDAKDIKNIKDIKPLSGGTDFENVFRVDEKNKNKEEVAEELKKAVSSFKNGYFEVPPIF